MATGVESRAEAKAAEGRVEATAAAATLAATEAETKAELATAAVATRKAGAMAVRLPYSASFPR